MKRLNITAYLQDGADFTTKKGGLLIDELKRIKEEVCAQRIHDSNSVIYDNDIDRERMKSFYDGYIYSIEDIIELVEHGVHPIY